MKTYLVVTESVYDYEVSHKYQSFIRRCDAECAFRDAKREVIKSAPDDWITENDDSTTDFSIFEEGYYAQNHSSVELVEMDTYCGYIDLEVAAVKKDEQALFKEKCEHLEFTEREDGDKVYPLPTNDEEGNDILPVILCNFDCGPVDLRVERIVKHHHQDCTWYTLEGTASDDWYLEYDADLDDVECGHLDYVTQTL